MYLYYQCPYIHNVCGRMRQIFGTIFRNVCMIVVCLHLTPGHVGVVSTYNAYVWLVSTPATYVSVYRSWHRCHRQVSRYNVRPKYRLLVFIFFVRTGTAGPLSVLPSPASLSSVAVSLSPITVTTPTVIAPFHLCPSPIQ